MNIKIKRLHEDAITPMQSYDDDFCYDCVAVSEKEILPNVWKYGLGFALQIDRSGALEGCSVGVTLRPRSSVWKTGMVLSNCIGTIDEGYTGEISAVFYHVLPNMPRYRVGDKIGQIHLDFSPKIRFIEVDNLNDTKRGEGGYGSTGR